MCHVNVYNKLNELKQKRKLVHTTKSIKVDLNMQTIYAAFVELVSKNGRPFCICEDSGIRIIIDPILEGVYKQTGQKHTINRLVLEKKVHEAYLIVLDRMKAEMKNKPITLMLDITTKHNRAILGINVRFFSGSRHIIRSLSMKELNKRHTAANIYEMVKETLAEFEIQPGQIFAYVSDNAGNVINVADFLDTDAESDSMNIDDQVFSMINQQWFDGLMTELQDMFTFGNDYVTFVSCAAHTCQLAVKDSLKEDNFQSLIKTVKDVVKELRTPTISRILRERHLKQAIIDHNVRWNYTYLMVICFHT